MKKKLNFAAGHAICLSVLLMVCCVTIIVCKALVPAFILPRITITTLVALSLAAMVLARWIFRSREKPRYAETVLLAAAAYGVMSWAVGFATVLGAVKVGISGGIAYGVCLLALSSMEAQLESSSVKHKAPALTLAAALLLLASQSLAGIPILR